MVLTTAYLGDIAYFRRLASGRAEVEAWEHFQKQTSRNRAEVMTAQGVRVLTVPIEWQHGEKMPIRQVRIDYHEPWQRIHWRTLQAAYAAAPYFDHYAQRIEPFYLPDYRPAYLFEFNTTLTQTLLSLLGIPCELRFTPAYQPQPESQPLYCPPYHQVFADRQPFVPNLSVIDLLFCEGPFAKELIQPCHAQTPLLP